MKTAHVLRLLYIGLFAGTFAGCTTTGGHSALAERSEPHATLEELLQGDVTSTEYPAKLVRIDGRLVGAGRRTYLITPGTHTLSFELDVDAIREYEPGPGWTIPKPSKLSADLMEKQLTVTFIEGERYKFGAIVEDYNYAGWTPFVVGAETMEAEPME